MCVCVCVYLPKPGAFGNTRFSEEAEKYTFLWRGRNLYLGSVARVGEGLRQQAQSSLSELLRTTASVSLIKMIVFMESRPSSACVLFFLCWMNCFSGIRGLFIAVSYLLQPAVGSPFCRDYDSQDLSLQIIWKESPLGYVIHLFYKWGKKKLEKKWLGGLRLWTCYLPMKCGLFFQAQIQRSQARKCVSHPKSIYIIYLKVGSKH